MNSIRHQTCSLATGLPTAPALFLVLASAVSPAPASAQDTTPRMPVIELVTDDSGTRLRVDGEDMMVQGVNWDYFPIGTTYNYNFWTEPDHIIEAALEREMSLLKAMGGNAIRTYVGITPRWVRHIYERYGIFTILNHAMGRYGVTVGGVLSANTDYSDPRAREVLTAEIEEMVNDFKDTPGLLMWLLGNENNYGLVWSSAETEDLPEGEANAVRARHMYSLFGDVARSIKEMDPALPIAMANGDLQYLEIIAEEVPDLDVFGTNVYRGISFGQLFQEVHDKLDRPVMFTEFGADVWNAKDMREDQVTQAKYLIGQWREIYEQSAGKGLVGNSIGGLTFQWSDGWWKFGQESRLDIQDTNASWANGGYVEDFVEGRNNMNEEWWGIVAKGSPDHNRLYELYPRAAYYALQQAYTLDPYARPRGRAGPLRRHAAGRNGTAGSRRPGRASGHGPRPRPPERRPHRTGNVQHGRLPRQHPGGGARAEPRLPELPRLRQDAVLLRGPDGAACEEHARDRLVQRPGRRPHEPHRRDLLREPGPSAQCEDRRRGCCAARHRAPQGVQRERLMGRRVVQPSGLLPHRTLPLGL